MNSIYIPILKAKQGEFDALAHISGSDFGNFTPWFDVPMLDQQKMRALRDRGEPPVATYLNSVATGIASSCTGREAFVDLPRWPTHSQTEHGEHVIPHTVNRLSSLGVRVNPVIDHESWADPLYVNAFRGMRLSQGRSFCIRLSMNADTVEDLSDPEYFRQHIDTIVERLSIDTSQSTLLIDFSDVSSQSKTVPDIIDETTEALSLLRSFKFGRIMMAGCSLPPFISSAVESQNSTGLVLRKELVAWQGIRQMQPNLNLVFADYGVRNPSSSDVHTKYQNGKIRYTKDKEYFVVRGFPICTGVKGAQYYQLSKTVVESEHYLGSPFSWGDDRILRCSNEEFKGRSHDWIAIDTNHHIATVLAELREFQHQLATRPSGTVFERAR